MPTAPSLHRDRKQNEARDSLRPILHQEFGLGEPLSIGAWPRFGRRSQPGSYSRTSGQFQVRRSLFWLILWCRVEASSSTSVAERFIASGSRMGMRLVPTESRRTWISKACSA